MAEEKKSAGSFRDLLVPGNSFSYALPGGYLPLYGEKLTITVIGKAAPDAAKKIPPNAYLISCEPEKDSAKGKFENGKLYAILEEGGKSLTIRMDHNKGSVKRENKVTKLPFVPESLQISIPEKAEEETRAKSGEIAQDAPKAGKEKTEKPYMLSMTPKLVRSRSILETKEEEPRHKLEMNRDFGSKAAEYATAGIDAKKGSELRRLKEDVIELLASNAKFDSYIETIDGSSIESGSSMKTSLYLDVDATQKKRADAAEGAVKAALAGDVKALESYGIKPSDYAKLAKDYPMLAKTPEPKKKESELLRT